MHHHLWWYMIIQSNIVSEVGCLGLTMNHSMCADNSTDTKKYEKLKTIFVEPVYIYTEIWCSWWNLNQFLWKLFSKRTCQESSGQDGVKWDFVDPFKPSQSYQDRHLPENSYASLQLHKIASALLHLHLLPMRGLGTDHETSCCQGKALKK